MKRNICVMTGCVHEVQYKKSELCGACYAFIYYWKRSTVTHMMKYLGKLEFRQGRMDTLLGGRKVTRLKRKSA